MLERAAQGKRTCSEILGYDLDGKDSFKINKKEAEYVRFCFSEYLLRKNLSEVAKEAKQRGFKGKRGKIQQIIAFKKFLQEHNIVDTILFVVKLIREILSRL